MDVLQISETSLFTSAVFREYCLIGCLMLLSMASQMGHGFLYGLASFLHMPDCKHTALSDSCKFSLSLIMLVHCKKKGKKSE